MFKDMQVSNSSPKHIVQGSKKAYSIQQFMNSKPVFKLSREGMLLYASSSGIEFLELISDVLKVPAIKYLIKSNPSILNPHCSMDLSVKVNQMKFRFSVVACDPNSSYTRIRL